MTRETKIGMAVAVSFLSLVGIVVVTKWRGANGGPPNGNVALDGKGATPGKGVDNPPIQPQKNKSPIQTAGLTDPTQPIEGNPPINPLPNGNNNEPSSAKPPFVALPNNANTPTLPAPPPVPVITNPDVPPVPATLPGNNAPAVAALDKDEAKRKALLELTKQQDAAFPPLPGNPSDDKIKGANVVDNGFNRGNEFAKKGIDDVNKQFPKLDEGFNKQINAANQFAQGAPNKNNDLFNRDPTNGNKQITLPPPENNPAVPPAPMPGNNNPSSTQPPQPAFPQVETKAPAIPTQKDFGLPTIDTKPPSIPAPRDNGLPPITNSNTSNPPFVIPQPKANEPQVIQYDLKTHVARQGDTFASLSREFYRSDLYANALMAYNREWSKDRNITTLQAGQNVLLPSLQVLQQDRYARAGLDNRPNIGAAPVSIAPAVPINPMRAFAPTTPTTDVTKSYRIAAGGQKIYELAIQTLGDGSRWTEIYRLNPMLDPLQPIPGNTVVRLPANANVP